MINNLVIPSAPQVLHKEILATVTNMSRLIELSLPFLGCEL